MSGPDGASHDGDPELGKYRTLVEIVGDPMYILDDDGRITFANEAMAATVGLDREAVVGSHVSRFVPDEDVQRGTEILLDLADEDDRTCETFEMRIRTADGDGIETENEVAALTDGDGALSGSVGVIRDVTEREEHERELPELNRKIERLHGVAIDLQSVERAEEVYQLTIDAARDILGFDWCVVAMAEEGWLELKAVSEEAPVAVGERHLRVDEGTAGAVYQSGTSRIMESPETDPDSDPVDDSFVANLTVSMGDRGVFQASSASAGYFDEKDLELAELLVASAAEALARVEREQQLRERERELQRQNERLDQFASVVSHDLRNPLQVARGYLEMLDDDGPAAEIGTSLDRMETIIADVLELARQGRTIDGAEPVDLGDAARTAWQNVDTRAATRTVETDATLHADEERFVRLLENIFRNVVEHAGEDATVRIGATENGFYVADDGPGIPPDERERVFETGYTTADDGTGFGLAIVAEIAEAHGWTVEVVEHDAPDALDERSETDDRSGGARFEFTGVERAS